MLRQRLIVLALLFIRPLVEAVGRGIAIVLALLFVEPLVATSH